MYKRVEQLYDNKLASMEDIKDFKLEGEAAISFPMGRMRMENKMSPEEGQNANYVFWCHKDFPDNIEVTWDFLPIREPGLCIFFFAATGKNGEDIFDPSLAKRTGPYSQYNNSDINALHISYFRRRYEDERRFQICNLRKSCGFHLVMQGADPIPSVQDTTIPYKIKVIKSGTDVLFYVDELLLFSWHDDGKTYGPVLEGGKIGFRQMAPLMAEYANLEVYRIEKV